MKNGFRVFAASLIWLAAGSAIAAPTSYVCEIFDFMIPGSDTEDRQWVGERAKETSVAIDRLTGRVIHPSIGNTSFQEIRLLNKGDAEWSFKSFADSGEGGHTRYYEVHEYAEGTVKPFLAVADGVAFFGECE